MAFLGLEIILHVFFLKDFYLSSNYSLPIVTVAVNEDFAWALRTIHTLFPLVCFPFPLWCSTSNISSKRRQLDTADLVRVLLHRPSVHLFSLAGVILTVRVQSLSHLHGLLWHRSVFPSIANRIICKEQSSIILLKNVIVAKSSFLIVFFYSPPGRLS